MGSPSLPSATSARRLGALGIGMIPRRDGNSDVHNHAQDALEVVALAVAQKVANDQDGHDQHDGVEELKN